jgi:hypothetical protein
MIPYHSTPFLQTFAIYLGLINGVSDIGWIKTLSYTCKAPKPYGAIVLSAVAVSSFILNQVVRYSNNFYLV